MKLATIVLLFACALPLAAQKKQTVSVVATCKETIGSSFLYYFNEAVRSSSAYTLESSIGKPWIFVDIACIDTKPDRGAAVSVFAYQLRPAKLGKGFEHCTLMHTLIHEVLVFPPGGEQRDAIGVLADIDQEAAKLD